MADDGDLRRLTRSNDRMVGGVAAGIAEYVDVDPTIVRLVFALLLLLGGLLPWVLVYLVLWVIMPAPALDASGASGRRSTELGGGADPGLVFGVMLVGLGLLLLANQFALVRFVGFGAARAAWPLLLIGAGAMILLMSRDRGRR
jgi:phage shock protein PspC (stress-responsive transcriptional regulator)